MTDPDRRWPRRVYATGDEPDPRFSFANERTFLAWVRTALALLAGGVALRAVSGQIDGVIAHGCAALLVVLGMICAATAFRRWSRSERALREGRPLPTSALTLVLTVGVTIVALGLLILVII